MHDISASSIAGLSKRIAVAEVRRDGADNSVLQPMEMYLDLGFGGVQSLGILDKAKAWQIVLLRDPLMLPRPAAIT